MKKELLLCSVFICIVLTSFAQTELSKDVKHHVIIEDQIMFFNYRDIWFPIINSESSISYGITDYLEAGAFYDLHYFRISKYVDEPTTQNLYGIKLSCSLFPLLRHVGVNFNPSRFELNLSGDFGVYKQKEILPGGYFDKKDDMDWPNYYRVGARYFLCRNFYLTASTGLYNTDRFFMGIGIKL